MMKSLSCIILVFSLISCTSDNTVKEIDTSLDVKGSIGSADVGVDDDGVAILQVENDASDELRSQYWKNNELENKLNHEYYMLKWCREDLADPRLGGDGEMLELPEIDKMKSTNKIKEEFGIEGKGLKIVKREQFLERLKTERKYESTLTEMISLVQKSRGQCERKMSVARISAGLPGKRYSGKVELNSSGTIKEVIYPQEKSLDDAFRILQMQKNN